MDREDLEAAEAHIARLEEELLRLKDVKRELQKLLEEHQRLRRSAEGRAAKILTAPFRWFRRSTRNESFDPSEYETWFARHRVSPDEVRRLREQSRSFSYRPLISILTPAFDSNEKFLSAAIESVIEQAYENWELILVDDGSNEARVRETLEKFAARESGIHFLARTHRGISAALNQALAHAKGEWIALLDHDDLLEPDALFRVIELLQSERETDVIYSDEDKIIGDRFAAPMLKPDWSPDFFCTHDYLGHFVVIRRELARIRFRSEFDGAQDYDLLLRASERTERIRHIPRVLYHWRRTEESTAHNIRRKPGALEAGRRAIEEHLARQQENGRVTIDWETHLYRVRRQIGPAKISVVINGGDGTVADRIRARTGFPSFEIVADLKDATGEQLLFLDFDLQPLDKNWMVAMAEQLSNPKIGAVGARILALDYTIESAGLILSPDGTVRPAFAGFEREFRGANRQLQTVRNYSAVSASCLLTRRELFVEQFSNCPSSFDRRLETYATSSRICASAEFCLKLHEQGLRVVSVPYAELRRTSSSKDGNVSCPNLVERFPKFFQRDPYYNPNLSSERADFSLGT